MAHYIDKDALVAEIEKRIEETQSMQPKFDQFWAGQISAFKGVLKILDTHEVKEVEVDLESEMDKYFDEHDKEFCRGEYLDYAKHFFELGLKAKQE